MCHPHRPEVAAHALHADGPDWHSLSPGTLELAELITCWPQLPEPIRQVILTIVRSVNVPLTSFVRPLRPIGTEQIQAFRLNDTDPF